MRFIFSSILVAALTASAYGQGACCLEEGCEVLPDQFICEDVFGGIWAGDNTDCTTVNCLSGACCVYTFEYECWDESLIEDCNSMGGQFLGPLSTCDDEGAFCQSDVGACCIDGNKCWDTVPEDECYWMGGKFIGNDTTCLQDATWCVTYYGSCCFGDSCQDWVEHDECEMMGGIFWLDACADLQDVEMCMPSGACCIESECETDIDYTNCLLAGGEWFDDSTCDSDSCKDQPSCAGDLDENGTVDVDDLLQVLAVFDTSSQGDCDGDKDTDVDDLLLLISAWGPCL